MTAKARHFKKRVKNEIDYKHYMFTIPSLFAFWIVCWLYELYFLSGVLFALYIFEAIFFIADFSKREVYWEEIKNPKQSL